MPLGNIQSLSTAHSQARLLLALGLIKTVLAPLATCPHCITPLCTPYPTRSDMLLHLMASRCYDQPLETMMENTPPAVNVSDTTGQWVESVNGTAANIKVNGASSTSFMANSDCHSLCHKASTDTQLVNDISDGINGSQG